VDKVYSAVDIINKAKSLDAELAITMKETHTNKVVYVLCLTFMLSTPCELNTPAKFTINPRYDFTELSATSLWRKRGELTIDSKKGKNTMQVSYGGLHGGGLYRKQSKLT